MRIRYSYPDFASGIRIRYSYPGLNFPGPKFPGPKFPGPKFPGRRAEVAERLPDWPPDARVERLPDGPEWPREALGHARASPKHPVLSFSLFLNV